MAMEDTQMIGHKIAPFTFPMPDEVCGLGPRRPRGDAGQSHQQHTTPGILTEETGHKWGDIKVTKPEPVTIMGATSADSIWFDIFDSAAFLAASGRFGKLIDSGVLDKNEVRSHQQAWNSDFLGNKFAFLTKSELSYQVSSTSKGKLVPGIYALKIYLDYPGTTPTKWNDTYFGSGAYAGANFPNTAYVHIYKRVIEQYKATYDSVTVIQYKYFYPYNHWWNSHEGDWQGIDVVVSSSDPNTAQILGVEYRFHGAWLNYYKDWGSNPGLTTNFVFNPRTEVRLSPGPKRSGIVQYTHPIIYVGAGSHGGYPIGGNVQIYRDFAGSYGDFEYMTPNIRRNRQ